MPRLYIKTMGCKVNTFDSNALINQFRADGYEVVEDAAAADVAVVNTCSVTANSDREARYLARRLRRNNPQAVLVYTGCYAQTDSAALAAMDEIDFVVPNAAKHRLVDIARDATRLKRLGHKPPSKLPEGVDVVAGNRQQHFKSSVTFFDRADSNMTRIFLKIQDGCDNFCTYCLIPYARGTSRSVGPEDVLNEVSRLAAKGIPELVLTGIHIGDYGRDLAIYAGDTNPIVRLIQEILAIPGLGRIRISSLEPCEVTDPLLDLLARHRERICDHWHLPLQSGAAPVLKRMRRNYDPAGYADAVTRIRRHFPEASIGADVIPGFPGETDQDFTSGLQFIRSLELSYLHVFPYSKRPNTAAARMDGHLDGLIIKQRAAQLRELSTELATNYSRRFVGRTVSVLWEQDHYSQELRQGLTANYLQVTAVGGEQPAPGTITLASLKGFGSDGRLLARPLFAPSTDCK